MSNNTATIKTRENLVSTRTITMTALLAAISYVLAFLELPVPLSPSFARMDLSDLPALIGAFAFGPVTGVMIGLTIHAKPRKKQLRNRRIYTII